MSFYDNDQDRALRNCTCYNVVAITDGAHTYGPFQTCTGDYNCADNTTAPGANSLDNKSKTDVDWEDYANGDLRIGNTSDLSGAGKGSGTYAEVLDVDLAGNSRPTGDCAIGAFEYVADAAAFLAQIRMI